jgi:protein-arginine kinase activator protein McsA
MPDLDDLIGDGCIIGCRHVLKEVFLHLKARNFRLNEIVNSVADILEEEGFEQAARTIEDVATTLRQKPQTTEKDDDLGFL